MVRLSMPRISGRSYFIISSMRCLNSGLFIRLLAICEGHAWFRATVSRLSPLAAVWKCGAAAPPSHAAHDEAAAAKVTGVQH